LKIKKGFWFLLGGLSLFLAAFFLGKEAGETDIRKQPEKHRRKGGGKK